MSSGNPAAPAELPSAPQHTLWLEHTSSSLQETIYCYHRGNLTFFAVILQVLNWRATQMMKMLRCL